MFHFRISLVPLCCMRHTFEIDQNLESINIPLFFFPLVSHPSLFFFLILELGPNQSFYLHSVLGSKFCPTYYRATPALLSLQTLINLTFVFYSLTPQRLNIAWEYFINLLIGTFFGLLFNLSCFLSLGKLFLQILNPILYRTTKSSLTSKNLFIFNRCSTFTSLVKKQLRGHCHKTLIFTHPSFCHPSLYYL